MIDITETQLEIVRDILDGVLPQGGQAFAFGSRVDGNAEKFSDLDIAIDTGSPLSLEFLEDLRYRFASSALPMSVDIADWTALPESFRNEITKNGELLYSKK